MRVSYKFGLFLLFILSISFYHTRAAPATNETITYDDDYRDDDYDGEYYDDKDQNAKKTSSEIKSTSTPSIPTKSSLFFSLFDIPKRSNHVVEPTCPKACLCLEDYKYINCAHAKLTQIPRDIPTTALIIDLSDNQIREIKKTDFSHRTKLQEINLNRNYIDKLEQEIFADLPRLQRLRLADNLLTVIQPDTFQGASDLSLLDLSNNSIILNDQDSFLVQPSLLEFNCRNCSWTQIYDDTFKNISGLTALRIDLNDFNKKINTRAFIPLRNLIKLRLPELDQTSIEELCNLLKFIDNISFKHFDVSCYELVLGATYNESVILATEPPFKKPKLNIETEQEIERSKAKAQQQITSTLSATVREDKKANNTQNDSLNMSSSNMTLMTNFDSNNNTSQLIKAGIMATAANPVENNPEEPYKVPISQEAINFLLIALMVISVIGIIIGIICRKDVGGIKTKCCRTKKTLDDEKNTEADSPAEEIPLNKLA